MGCTKSNQEQEPIHCCPPGSWPALKLNYTPVGKDQDVNGLRVYHVGTGKKVLLILEDIFGINEGRHKTVCDTYATMGYNVYMPEFLDPPYSGGLDVPKILEHIKKVIVWPDINAKYEKLTKHLNSQGHTKWLCAGYCLGAWLGFHFSKDFDNITAIASIHPSFQSEKLYGSTEQDLMKNVKCPSFFFVAGNDHQNTKKEGALTKIMVDKYKDLAGSFEFPKQVHGWVIRSNPDNEEAKKDIETVFSMSHDYFKKFA